MLKNKNNYLFFVLFSTKVFLDYETLTSLFLGSDVCYSIPVLSNFGNFILSRRSSSVASGVDFLLYFASLEKLNKTSSIVF